MVNLLETIYLLNYTITNMNVHLNDCKFLINLNNLNRI
jgi:hypothetical protein